jgi:hypothetical protein
MLPAFRGLLPSIPQLRSNVVNKRLGKLLLTRETLKTLTSDELSVLRGASVLCYLPGAASDNTQLPGGSLINIRTGSSRITDAIDTLVPGLIKG